MTKVYCERPGSIEPPRLNVLSIDLNIKNVICLPIPPKFFIFYIFKIPFILHGQVFLMVTKPLAAINRLMSSSIRDLIISRSRV